MNDFGFWSLIPSILAILLAIRTKQVVFSLFLGIFTGYVILRDGNIFIGFIDTIEGLVKVFENKGSTRTIIFTLLVGSIMQLIHYSGGINGFVNLIKERLQSHESSNKRKIEIISILMGFMLFIETNISILSVGSVFRPLFDKYKIGRQRLAYYLDSSCSPSCVLFPLNAWGAYVISLLLVFENIDPVSTLIYSIPFNFYALLTMLLVLYVAISGYSYGFDKVSESVVAKTMTKLKTQKEEVYKSSSALNMLIPIGVLMITMPFFLIYSGWNYDLQVKFSEKIWNAISNSSGSQAVVNSCFLSYLVALVMCLFQKKMSLKESVNQTFLGMKNMHLMAVLMCLAFALGNVCLALNTGIYVSGLASEWVAPEVIPVVVFVVSGFISFSTGTSWGTFAIMIAIGMPMTESLGVNAYLMLGAILGGGIFGDHCSPISDTTLISSVASGCDHIEHVRTQLPYALFSGILSCVFYLLAGYLL